MLKATVTGVAVLTALGAPAAFAAGPTSAGTSWVVMNAANGHILSKHEPYTLRYPASLTKLMTLDLAFNRIDHGHLSMQTRLPVSRAAADVQPVKLGLRPGQTISVKNAMLGMTTMSANDAATALGLYLGHGSMRRFAREATERAHALGMLKTRFMNSSGLPKSHQLTDAYDIALLTRHILRTYPRFGFLFRVHGYRYRGRWIPNINGMLTRYRGTIGMKTGFTDRARFNVVTAARRNGHVLIGVLFHARSWGAAYHQMALLLDRGFHKLDHRAQPHTARLQLISAHSRPANHSQPADHQWAAQVGTYATRAGAERQATEIHHMRGIGRARVRSTVIHGHRLWRAELAELDNAGARYTCHMMKRYHRSCLVLDPPHTAPHRQEGHRVVGTNATEKHQPSHTPLGTVWAAQVGVFSSYTDAKRQALQVQHLQGRGVPLIVGVPAHGHILWRARLAGLSQDDAHDTCEMMERRHQSCFVVHPPLEHLAMR